MLGVTPQALRSRFLKDKFYVVHSRDQLTLLRNSGFSHVFHGCLSYAYLDCSPFANPAKIPGLGQRDTLVILPKSQAYASKRDSFDAFLSYVNDSTKLSQESVLCVFVDDIWKESVCNLLSSQCVPFCLGASPSDPYALLRIDKILESFKEILTNTMGTHVPHASKKGLKVTIVAEIYDQRDSAFILSCWPQGMPYPDDAYFDYLEYVHSKAFLLRDLGFLLDPGFWGACSVNWGHKQMLGGGLLGYRDLKRVLGWSACSKMRSSYLSLAGKMENLVSLHPLH
jgi:hypothetical protein